MPPHGATGTASCRSLSTVAGSLWTPTRSRSSIKLQLPLDASMKRRGGRGPRAAPGDHGAPLLGTGMRRGPVVLRGLRVTVTVTVTTGASQSQGEHRGWPLWHCHPG